MAALNFPSSPTLNQVYTANNRSWIWDGTSWVSVAAVTGGSINNTTIGATTPSTGAFTTLSTTGILTVGNSAAGAANIEVQRLAVAFSNTAGHSWAFNWATSGGTLINRIAAESQNSGNNVDMVFSTYSSNTLAERARISGTGIFSVGASTAPAGLTVLNALVSSDTAAGANFMIRKSATAVNGPNLTFAKSRGTAASPSAIAKDDFIGGINFTGFDGTNYIAGAQITAIVSNTSGTNDIPTDLLFYTTPDGTAQPQERMRITSGGIMAVGGSVVGTTCAGSAVSGINIGNAALTASLGLGINSTSATGTQYFVGFGRGGSLCGQIYSDNTNSTTYATSSDRRLKDSIEDFTDSGRLIDLLQPRVWKWKQDGSFGLGFIAQEQHASDPIFSKIGAVLVGDDEDSIKKQWMRSDQSLVPILVAELKSLRARVAQLEAK